MILYTILINFIWGIYGKKLQTIYEYFKEYSEEEINNVLKSLAFEEKTLVTMRYGEDLHNPKTSINWTTETSRKYYGSLIPKIRRLLQKVRSNSNGINNQESKTIIISEESNAKKNEVVDHSSTILGLIHENKTNNEICQSLNISPERFYEELMKLRNRGISFSRKYYSDAVIKYEGISTISWSRSLIADQDRAIITGPTENSMKILAISDLHFGNERERIDLVNRAYNYCVKNGIRIILCGGDLIDGSFSKGNQKISDLYQQVEYFLKNYPYDQNILTFSVAGDHDLSVFRNSYINLIDACNNLRHDIIIGGYNNMGINIKNDAIHLYHHVNMGTLRQTNAPLILHGHAHKFTTEIRNNSLNVTIPSLSDINESLPSALELNISFTGGLISYSVIKQIYFGPQDIILNELSFNTLNGRSISDKTIRNIEVYSQNNMSKQVTSQVESYQQTSTTNEILSQSEDKPKSLVKINRPLTQTEKFYKRYGNTVYGETLIKR